MKLLTEREAKLLEELHERREMRLRLVDRSIAASKRRLADLAEHHQRAGALYHEALLQLADDDEDPWDIARAKAERLEEIEQQYIDASPLLKNASDRVVYDLVNAVKIFS